MRVGRINAIKLVPYRDVKTLLRYFSIKGVAQAASKENELAKINTLQAYDNTDINQKISTRNALNNMVLDGIEKNTIMQLEKNNSLSSNKEKIEVIKSMKNLRKGNKVSALDLLANSQIKSGVLGMQNKENIGELENTNKPENTNKNEMKFYENKVEVKDRKEEDNVSVKDKKEETKSLFEEYTEMLKNIDSKKEEKLSNKVELS